MSMHDPNALTPAEEAWLRDPRHPVNNGFQLHPVPNLIIPNPPRYSIAERHRYRVSHWVHHHVIRVHYAPMQRFLTKAGMIALVLSIIALPPILFWPMTCDGSTEITEESFSCYSSY